MDAFPPWTLRGHGLVVPCRPNLASLSASDRAEFRSGPALMMLLNYTSSPVGPYRELVVVGGLFETAGLVRPRVTRILVDSEDSARWGRRNWGLPKEIATFEREGSFVRVVQGGHLLVECAWAAHGPKLPVTTAFVPGLLGTLAQPLHGRVYLTRPRGKGLARIARLTHHLVNFEALPIEAPSLLALHVTDFEAHFPHPATREATVRNTEL